MIISINKKSVKTEMEGYDKDCPSITKIMADEKCCINFEYRIHNEKIKRTQHLNKPYNFDKGQNNLVSMLNDKPLACTLINSWSTI